MSEPTSEHASEAQRRYMRQLELPTAIIELSRNNALVHRAVSRFLAGHIVTPTECLCQCIVDLDRNWPELQRRAADSMIQFERIQVDPNRKGL